MEMPEKIIFTFQKHGHSDAQPYSTNWEILFRGKRYGCNIDIAKLDPDYLKAVLDALADEALLTIHMLNEPLLGRSE